LVQIPGFISVGLLTVIVAFMIANWQKLKKQYLIFMGYCLAAFVYELALLVTWIFHFENHLIANINTVIYLPLTCFLICNIYMGFYKTGKAISILKKVVVGIIITTWVLENFFFGTIYNYNSLLPGFASIVFTLGGIYIVNILIFAKTGDFLKDPEVLIVVGLLIRSIIFGFTLWFLNFDYGFSQSFYSNLLGGINIGLCISDLLFLYAIQRILGAGKKLIKN
jgi:hypothetical protein